MSARHRHVERRLRLKYEVIRRRRQLYWAIKALLYDYIASIWRLRRRRAVSAGDINGDSKHG